MTVVYLVRHSRGNFSRFFINTKESFQIENEKYILSVEGERKAKKIAKLDELKNIDYVVSSNYVRAMSTAKYISHFNNIPLNVDDDFNERKFGVDDIRKIPQDFFTKQMQYEDYKLENGESRKEVRKRMLNGLAKVMKKNLGKRIVIVSHASSISFLLTKWCSVEMIDSKYVIKFKGKEIINGFDSPEVLKLEFNDKHKLVNICSIKIKYSIRLFYFKI